MLEVQPLRSKLDRDRGLQRYNRHLRRRNMLNLVNTQVRLHSPHLMLGMAPITAQCDRHRLFRLLSNGLRYQSEYLQVVGAPQRQSQKRHLELRTTLDADFRI